MTRPNCKLCIGMKIHLHQAKLTTLAAPILSVQRHQLYVDDGKVSYTQKLKMAQQVIKQRLTLEKQQPGNL